MTTKQEEAEVEAAGKGAAEALKSPAILGTRHLVCFMMLLCMAIEYIHRVILSVSIVAMCGTCSDRENNEDFPTYDWSDYKDTILSSFFWGYVVTQLPGGMVAQRFGGKMVLLVSAGVTSAVALLTPLLADAGWGWMCAARVVQGLSQGVIFPSFHALLAKWAPPSERGRLATYVYAGAQMGTIVGMPVAGWLADSSVGWPFVFYLFGALGAVWTACWFFLGASEPATHRWCSEAERQYIEASLRDSSKGSNAETPATPWKSIFTSVPMWALIIVHCGQNWGFWTLLTEMPSYMDGVLGFDLASNGLLSALPYLVMWILSFIFSWISDYANKKKWISLSVSRKIFNSIGHWGPALALLGVGFVETNVGAVALLTVAVGLDAAVYVGFQVNHIDLSPNFAGTMMGITNCAANIMSIIGPLLVGILVDDQSSQEQWRIVFFVACGFYFVGNLTFVLFGSAETQPWNTPSGIIYEDNTEQTEDKKT